MGKYTQPLPVWQMSLVQGLPSMQSFCFPGRQLPPWHWSSWLQTSPSSQASRLGVWLQVPSELQPSVVQWFLSSHAAGLHPAAASDSLGAVSGALSSASATSGATASGSRTSGCAASESRASAAAKSATATSTVSAAESGGFAAVSASASLSTPPSVAAASLPVGPPTLTSASPQPASTASRHVPARTDPHLTACFPIVPPSPCRPPRDSPQSLEGQQDGVKRDLGGGR